MLLLLLFHSIRLVERQDIHIVRFIQFADNFKATFDEKILLK